MPPASRHAKSKAPAIKRGAPVVAAATLAGVAAAFVSLQGGSAAAPMPARYVMPVTSAGHSVTRDRVTTDVRRDIAGLEASLIRASIAAQHKHLVALAAARLAQQQAAQQQAQQAAAQPSPNPSPSPSQSPSQSAAPAPSSGGGDAAHSALGICVRNAEEGGSYAWGPGNGGGAYQFVLGTWETYGGSASMYGVAGPAYQDQIFDNAIAAGGASNWTAYDGC